MNFRIILSILMLSQVVMGILAMDPQMATVENNLRKNLREVTKFFDREGGNIQYVGEVRTDNNVKIAKVYCERNPDSQITSCFTILTSGRSYNLSPQFFDILRNKELSQRTTSKKK